MRTTKFKASEIGPIPVEWEVKQLGDITEIGTGKRNGDEQIANGLYPFFVRSNVVYRINSFSFDGEAILVPGEGGIGEIFHYINGRFDFHQRVYKISGFQQNVCARYVYYYMRMYFGKWAKEQTVKATVDSLRLPTFELFKVPLPSLLEQRRIAAALSDADAWIESLEKLIEKKKLVKQGAMQALLSGKTRLPGFSGKWEERRLGECGVFRKGSGISREEGRSGNIPAVRYGELYTHHDCIIRIFASHISEAVARRATLLKPGDILFACSGETKEEIGKCAAFIHPVRAYAGGDLLIMTPNPSRCDSTFLGYALNASKCQIQKAAAGQGDAVVHIHKDALEAIEITLPPSLAEQRAIASVLSDMDAELAALSREKAKAEQIKQGMMQELLTGRVRLGEGE